jgi:hypothetical protein
MKARDEENTEEDMGKIAYLDLVCWTKVKYIRFYGLASDGGAKHFRFIFLHPNLSHLGPCSLSPARLPVVFISDRYNANGESRKSGRC